ncbi:MAG: hypothetical protein ACKV2T_10275 [Kofleriaceae bacterium]
MLRLFLIASLASAAITACAMAPEKTSMPPPRGTDARSEIETLDKQLTDQLARMEIQPFASSCAADKTCTADAPPPAATCTPAASCEDTCTLGESICTNATRICTLAGELGGLDAWANEKCTHARESCTAARERCCNCKS